MFRLAFQINDRVFRVLVEQLEELQEEGACLPLGEDVGNHNYSFCMFDGHATTQRVMPEKLRGALNVLRVFESDRVKRHGDRGL